MSFATNVVCGILSEQILGIDEHTYLTTLAIVADIIRQIPPENYSITIIITKILCNYQHIINKSHT